MVEEEIRFLLENEEFNKAVDRLLTLDNRMFVLLNFIYDYNAISLSGDPKKALELLNKCLLISEKLKIPEAISQSLNYLSHVYMLLGDFNNALVYLKRSYSICKDVQTSKSDHNIHKEINLWSFEE